jgi:hypothetical protein
MLCAALLLVTNHQRAADIIGTWRMVEIPSFIITFQPSGLFYSWEHRGRAERTARGTYSLVGSTLSLKTEFVFNDGTLLYGPKSAHLRRITIVWTGGKSVFFRGTTGPHEEFPAHKIGGTFVLMTRDRKVRGSVAVAKSKS